MRIDPGMKPKEPTYQVALDALALNTCYLAFFITAEVLVIYMHQFWATVTKHKTSYLFKIDNKKFYVNVEVFRDILNICPRIQRQEFDEPPTEEEALSFILELGHSREIKYITDVIGMYYKKNLDFVALIWEDLAYQIDNIDSKKQDGMKRISKKRTKTKPKRQNRAREWKEREKSKPFQPPQFPVIHQPPQEMSIQDMEDLKQQYLDKMKTLINKKDYRNGKIDIEIKGNFNGMSIEINKKKKLQQLEREANINTYLS
ncbi:hypothetical protein Tco_0566052 [Tanacetum coccineum]